METTNLNKKSNSWQFQWTSMSIKYLPQERRNLKRETEFRNENNTRTNDRSILCSDSDVSHLFLPILSYFFSSIQFTFLSFVVVSPTLAYKSKTCIRKLISLILKDAIFDSLNNLLFVTNECAYVCISI